MSELDVLREEIAFFDAHRDDWMARYVGKWALVKGADLIGTFDTRENGYLEGLKRFGVVPFLVDQIVDTTNAAPIILTALSGRP